MRKLMAFSNLSGICIVIGSIINYIMLKRITIMKRTLSLAKPKQEEGYVEN